MPRISASDMPTIERAGKASVYAPQMAELTELLNEDNFGEGEAVSFEVSKEKLDALVTALRKAGSKLDRKVKTVYRDGVLYAKDGGAVGTEPASATAIRSATAKRGAKKAA